MFPDSVHVRDVGLKDADDREVWSFASKRAFIIATKDSDFNDLSFLHGFPPFVVWLNIGNCTTDDVERVLRSNCEFVTALIDSQSVGVIEIGKNQ